MKPTLQEAAPAAVIVNSETPYTSILRPALNYAEGIYPKMLYLKSATDFYSIRASLIPR
jgi:hypothetical protein